VDSVSGGNQPLLNLSVDNRKNLTEDSENFDYKNQNVVILKQLHLEFLIFSVIYNRQFQT